jgi:hypothetical protein
MTTLRFFLATASVLWAPSALAQSGSWGPHVDSIGVSLETRNVWRGFVRGSTTLRSALHVAMWGFPVTTEGDRGLTVDLAGWTALAERDDPRSVDQYSTTLALLQKLSRGPAPAILSLGLSAHLLPDAPREGRSTYEVVASIYGGRLPKWPDERRPRFYVDVARDLDESDVTFVRGGLVLDYSLLFITVADNPIWMFIDLSGSASDFPCAAGRCASMSLHAWRALARFVWDSPPTSLAGLDANVRLAIMGGGLWPRARISPNVGYGGIQLAVVF